MNRDGCNKGQAGWLECIECDGRIHAKECTTRRNPDKDCCRERHRRMGLSIETAEQNNQ